MPRPHDTLRKTAFAHRFITSASMLAVLLAVGAAGGVTAHPIAAPAGDYDIDYSMNRTDSGLLDVRARVVHTKTGDVIGEPNIIARAGDPATVQISRGERAWKVVVHANANGSGTLNLVVTQDGREIQNTATDFPAPGVVAARQFTGEPISLSLSNADIRDVMRTFGKLTGLAIQVAPNVTGSVDLNIKNVPWDRALEQILNEHGLSWRLEGSRLEVFEPKRSGTRRGGRRARPVCIRDRGSGRRRIAGTPRA